MNKTSVIEFTANSVPALKVLPVSHMPPLCEVDICLARILVHNISPHTVYILYLLKQLFKESLWQSVK